MRRILLRRLVVRGPDREDASVEFHRKLTFITGVSNTGKSHILKCLDFALGAHPPQRDFAEASGYTEVLLEMESDSRTFTVRRDFEDEDNADWFDGSITAWDPESADTLKVKISPKDPATTLSGRLLQASGFELGTPIVRNQKGESQSLSFRTIAPLALVSEEDVISETSPILPPSFTLHTAARSAFQLVISGESPTAEEIKRLRTAHKHQESAKQQVAVLEPIIASLRDEIAEAGYTRDELEVSVARIDEELGALSEQVAASGNRARALLDRRNAVQAAAEQQRLLMQRSQEIKSRFELLAEHYEADMKRLEFVLEGGHFFDQLSASFCPRCGQVLDGQVACHEESSEFAQIERASRAELKKLSPRISDLKTAIAEAEDEHAIAATKLTRLEREAQSLEVDIHIAANPSAEQARDRVQSLARQRRELEAELLRFKELSRYVAASQEAEVELEKSLDRFRPSHNATALRSFQSEVDGVLRGWQFPVTTDVVFSTATDDLIIDGKQRAANGKGVRAVTHAAFTVGLMRHCLASETPHPGLVAIDTPLTPFRGRSDTEEDPELRKDVHSATLRSLANPHAAGQSVIIENIDPPEGLDAIATVYVFTGTEGRDRAGFYPPRQPSKAGRSAPAR